jgi:hypothetical protein
MNVDELEEMLRELMAGIQELLQSGEVLSDEFQGAIAETLNNLTTQIDEARAQEIQQPQGRQPFQGQPPPTLNEAPPSPDAQLLWILSAQDPDSFIEYLHTYPTPSTQSLLNNPHELNRVIEYLNAMMPTGEQPVSNGIQHADLNSSTIWGSKYDPKNGKMTVRFQGGSEYEYEGIPPNIYRAFSKGQASAKTTGSNEYGAWWEHKRPSLGASLNQYIKAGGFNYRRTN